MNFALKIRSTIDLFKNNTIKLRKTNSLNNRLFAKSINFTSYIKLKNPVKQNSSITRATASGCCNVTSVTVAIITGSKVVA
jgi:spore coat protein U-like protein